MPWKDRVQRLKRRLDGLAAQRPAAAAQAAMPVSGESVFHADGPISADWEAQTGHGENGWGNGELQCYTDSPANAFYTDDGKLVVRAIVDGAGTADGDERRYTSARLVSRAPLGRDRGALTAVVQLPRASGVWPAVWLLPQAPFAWPADGEIDIAETWNGDGVTHACLHWGQHASEPQKHRVQATAVPDMHARAVRFDFVWDQTDRPGRGGGGGGGGGGAGAGRLLWYIDGRAVLKAAVPPGLRPLRDFTVLLNVALGGNVCRGTVPPDGHFDLVVHALSLASEPEHGGWAAFDADWANSATSSGSPY